MGDFAKCELLDEDHSLDDLDPRSQLLTNMHSRNLSQKSNMLEGFSGVFFNDKEL